jgi:acylphosphatase
MKAVDVIVSGRVQAVGFRAFTMRNALMLGVRGYVENLDDGRVHAVLEGDGHQVDKLLDMMRQGPRLARVKDITVKPAPLAGYQGFVAR